MNRIAVSMLVCALAFIPALAQQSHNHSQALGKKVRQQKVYSCPMHPEVTAKSKGKCPKCGMDLQTIELQGTSVDQCPVCRGAWLDQREIARLLERGLFEPVMSVLR